MFSGCFLENSSIKEKPLCLAAEGLFVSTPFQLVHTCKEKAHEQ